MSYSSSNEFVELLDEFSHDFRTPLGNIRLAADVLMSQQSADDREGAASLGAILKAEAGRLQRMVNTLQEWSRLHTDRSLRRQWHAAEAVVDAAQKQLGAIIESRSVDVSAQPEQARVHADQRWVTSLLAHLIDVVARGSSEDDAPIHVQIIADEHGCQIQLAARGGPWATQPRTPLDAGEARQIGQQAAPGVGLALVVAAQIVEAHGGQIWASRGAQPRSMAFVCRLPNDDEPPAEIGHDSDASAATI